MEYNFIKTENKDNVGLIILNRPEVLNTLNEKMLEEIADAAENYDKNPQIGAIIIQGSDKAFCAAWTLRNFPNALMSLITFWKRLKPALSESIKSKNRLLPQPPDMF